MEQEVRDHEYCAGDRHCEARKPRDREVVRDDEQSLLVALPPAESMVGARRDQQHGRERGRDEGDEEDVAVELAQLWEAVRERHREQEREEDLNAWERYSQLVEQLDQFSVVAIFFALVRHTLLFQPGWTLETGVFLD